MTKQYKLKNCIDFKHFGSLNEMADFCDELVEKSGSPYSRESSGTCMFYGAAESYGVAQSLIRDGWSAGSRRMQKALDAVREGMDSIEALEPELDICGPISMVGEYLAGNPECMLNPCMPHEKPVINIVVDTNAVASVSAKHMTNRGAAILALVKALQDSGREVAVYSAVTNSFGYDWHSYIVCLKQPGQEFNTHTMAYALAHPSMFRRHGFQILDEKCPSMGASIALTDVEGIEETIGDIDCYFMCSNRVENWQGKFGSPDSARDYVLETAREAGLIK